MTISPARISSGFIGATPTTLPVRRAGSILPESTTSFFQPKKGEMIMNKVPETIRIRRRAAANFPIRVNGVFFTFPLYACISLSRYSKN
jgi:hypothetical protein